MKNWHLYLMGALYIAAGINHFVNPDFYIRIMPPFIPWHGFMVAASGVAEIILGLGLFFPAFRIWAAWGIVAMLAVFMLVHVHMALHPEDYGVPFTALLVRLILQFPLILWATLYTRPGRAAAVTSASGE